MDQRLQNCFAHGIVALSSAAGRVGLLSALDVYKTANEVAAELDLSPRATELALAALCALGALERRGRQYRLLTGHGGPDPVWSHLDEFLRVGDVLEGIDTHGHRGPSYRRHVLALGEVFESAARELADVLPTVDSIVDVGAGSAMWSLSMAARTAHTRVLAVDLPEVVACSRVQATAMQLSERLQTRAANYFEFTLDERVNRLVLANVLHLESEQGAAALIARCANMITPDGELVIVDCLGDNDDFSDAWCALYTLHLGSRTEIGKPHPIAALRRWAEAAGLDQQDHIALARGGPFGALVCRRQLQEH
jgi:hypothetical protein